MASLSKKTKQSIILFVVLAACFLGARLHRTMVSFDALLSEPLHRGTIQESVYGIGTVEANRSYQMKTGVTSTVLRLFVREGDDVKRGAPLVDLDGIGILRAPFDGIVTSLSYKVGETVFSQSIVMTVTNLSDRYVSVSLEQQAALRVTRGLPVRINIDSMRDQVFTGKVEAVYSSGSDFLARIGVDNLPVKVLPGMTADVAISIQEKKNALAIPIAALSADGVWVKRGRSTPFKVSVNTGIIDGAMAEVTDGDLREGDRLLLSGKKSG
jgi:multidrug efflux pump subunit AcrA (membrane-fusion protein)